MVKFGYTIYYVSSVTETLAFFEKSFKMKRRFLTEEQDYGELETGETIFAFATHARNNWGQSKINPIIFILL